MGGGLYQVGGFTFPFAVTGALLYATAILVAVVMPRGASVSESTEKNGNGFGVFTILKIPGVMIAAFSIINAANSIGFLSSTLEPHIRQVLTYNTTLLAYIVLTSVTEFNSLEYVFIVWT